MKYRSTYNGNTIQMPHLSEMLWDHKDQLKEVDLGGGGTAYYVYDASGERVRKVIEKQGGIVEERLYLGCYEVFRRTNNGTLEVERKSIFVEDGNKTIAQIDDDGTTQTIRYQYDNHLGSASLELDENAEIISYEEYHPFGGTSYRSGRTETEVSLKRYKYVGKERDNETGLYYYGARYYADWIGRFVSVDPLQDKYPHYTPYQYAGNKPVSYIDLDGLEEDDPNKNNQINDYYGDKKFDDFVNKAIERFGFSDDIKLDIKLNYVDGEFVGGSVSVSMNGVTKKIDYTTLEGFSEISTTFDNEESNNYYNNFRNNGLKAIKPTHYLRNDNLPFATASENNENDVVSDVINIGGIASDIGEFSSPATWGKYKNSKGILRKIESLKQSKGLEYFKQGNVKAWGKTNKLSKLAKKAIRRAKFFRTLGRAFGILSMVYDWINVIRHKGKGAGKAALNSAFTSLAIWGGPIGAAVSAVYYSVDIFYPGGWKGFIGDSKNTMMKIYDLHTKDGVMMAPWLYGK